MGNEITKFLARCVSILMCVFGVSLWGTNGPRAEEASLVAGGDLSKVSGYARHVDDSGWFPFPMPISRGMVIAIPAARWEEVLTRLDVRTPPPESNLDPFGVLHFEMTTAQVEQFVSASSDLGILGGYAFDLPPDRYLFCLTKKSAQASPAAEAHPVLVYGCAPVEVSGKIVENDLYHAMGGVFTK